MAVLKSFCNFEGSVLCLVVILWLCCYLTPCSKCTCALFHSVGFVLSCFCCVHVCHFDFMFNLCALQHLWFNNAGCVAGYWLLSSERDTANVWFLACWHLFYDDSRSQRVYLACQLSPICREKTYQEVKVQSNLIVCRCEPIGPNLAWFRQSLCRVTKEMGSIAGSLVSSWLYWLTTCLQQDEFRHAEQLTDRNISPAVTI